MRTLEELRHEAAGSGTGCVCVSIEELNALKNEKQQLVGDDLVVRFIHGGMGPDMYELLLPWGGVLCISAEYSPDAGINYYSSAENYDRGELHDSLFFGLRVVG